MNIETFIDNLMETYESASCNIEADSINFFWKEVMTYYSDGMLKASLNKKNAARILYSFCRNVLHLTNVEWNKAKKLKDIYECRVCAEAIAQVYERGFIEASKSDIFGINDLMTDLEITKVLQMCSQEIEAS